MTYTNNNTDLAIKIHKIHHRYENGDVKCRYTLYNKRNNIVYESKNGKISYRVFKWNCL